MQHIARELNNSETAFIFYDDCKEYDHQTRFFTPKEEVPICGHATIAAHYALAYEKKLKNCTVYQNTKAGILPVEIIKEDDDYRIIMTQGKIEYGEIIDGESRNELLAALNIAEKDIRIGFPIQIVSTGHSKVMICINDRNLLNSLQPDNTMLTDLSSKIGCNGYYVFTLEDENSDILVHARMFAPAIGIDEDPVTGNANGPLGAYLVKHRLVKNDNKLFCFKAMQGEAIGRDGIINVSVKIKNNEPYQVSVSGNAKIIFKTYIYI